MNQSKQDERTFAGDTVGFYTKYRRGYPSELIAYLLKRCQGRRRLLDLGCGTGKLMLELAGSFKQAVGIDPEPDMLAEGKRASQLTAHGDVSWIDGKSSNLYQLAPSLGHFDLVTIGTAFHFMEPVATLAMLQQMAPDGVIAVVYNSAPMWLHREPWSQAIRSVLEARFGPVKDADFTLEALDSAELAMAQLGYRSIERWEMSYLETISPDFIVGHLLSALSVQQVPANQRRAFAEEIEKAVFDSSGLREIEETVPVRAVIANAN